MTDDAGSLHRLAAKLLQEGRRREAIEAFRRLVAARPDLAESWYNLGFLLKAEGRFDEALQAYDQALARAIAEPEEVHLNRAVIYADHLRQDDAAQRELEAALARNADYAPALLNLGNLHEERGAREAAVACYDRVAAAIDSPDRDRRFDANRLEALARLAHLRPPASMDDALLRRLKDAAAGAVDLDAMTRANLYFSLGRAYDALAAYDEAFAAYVEANRHARRSGPAYDRAQATRETEALIAAFPAPATAGRAGPDRAPIFICGMFRSGSTLVEQALAAHPLVTAGGELNILRRLTEGPLAPFPASAATLSDARCAGLAYDYLAQTGRLFPETAQQGRFLTDKRPDNFMLIGLIKRLFPAAKIVHTTRHPLDSSLSIFFQHIDQTAVGYSSDLGDIAHYQGQYRRLMAHWKVLYTDSIFEFDYDAFVREPRPALQGLLAFLGLDWDENCLEFHRVRNTVKTASYWQVRKPLYTGASGRWRHYEAHLGPLRTALAAEGVAPPATAAS